MLWPQCEGPAARRRTKVGQNWVLPLLVVVFLSTQGGDYHASAEWFPAAPEASTPNPSPSAALQINAVASSLGSTDVQQHQYHEHRSSQMCSNFILSEALNHSIMPAWGPNFQDLRDSEVETVLKRRKGPLYLVWVRPLGNSSLEHEWIEQWVLSRVDRPIVIVQPEQCHIEMLHEQHQPQLNVLYIVGATRPPDWLHDCWSRAALLRGEEHGDKGRARVGLIHLSDEYIGWGDYCKAEDSIERPIGYERCDSR